MNIFTYCVSAATLTSLLFAFVNTYPEVYSRADLPGVSIGPISRGTRGLAIVRKFETCGGRGKFIQARVEGTCRENSNCIIKADGKNKRLELDFQAGDNISPVGLVATLYSVLGLPLNTATGTIRNSSVKKGTKYTVKAAIAVEELLQGQTHTIRVVLNDADTETTDICVEALFKFT